MPNKEAIDTLACFGVKNGDLISHNMHPERLFKMMLIKEDWGDR